MIHVFFFCFVFYLCFVCISFAKLLRCFLYPFPTFEVYASDFSLFRHWCPSPLRSWLLHIIPLNPPPGCSPAPRPGGIVESQTPSLSNLLFACLRQLNPRTIPLQSPLAAGLIFLCKTLGGFFESRSFLLGWFFFFFLPPPPRLGRLHLFSRKKHRPNPS